MRLGFSLTGSQNRPAVPSGTGYEVDKLSREHTENYIKDYANQIKIALGDLYGKALNGVMLDSWEAGMQNWTDSMPSEIDTIDRRIIQLKIELQSLKKESDKTAKERRDKIEKEIAELKASMDQMKMHWSSEKEIIKKIQNTKSQMESLKTAEANAQRDGNLEKAAEIRYGKLVALDKELQKEQNKLEDIQKTIRCSRRKWTPKTWPRLFPTGRAYRFPG